MNIEQLRHSLKVKWSVYYQQNRSWLVKLRIWGTDQGQRRPASSFILATLSTLEPELTELLPFMIALNNDPDRIVSALGLNFDPDEELKLMADHQLQLMPDEKLQLMTVGFNDHFNESTAATVTQVEAKGDDLLTQKQLDDEDAAGQAKSIETSNHLEEALSSTGKPNYAGLMLSILAVISSLAFVFGGFTG